MKKEITIKGMSVKCDCCGQFVELSNESPFFDGDTDGSQAEQEAIDDGWLKIGNRHYCPDCWKRGEDGNIETNDGKRYDWKTRKDITPVKLKVIKVEVTEPTDFNEHFEAVDLGLPSGRKWADHNVGAVAIEDPEDYGYLMDFDSAQAYPLPDGWHLPTKEDFKELCEFCKQEWIEDGRLRGMRFTGKNGNSIFLPAAGYTWGDEDDVFGPTLDDRGSSGDYWSSSYNSAPNAFYLNFDSSEVCPQINFSRRRGFTVRAVR